MRPGPRANKQARALVYVNLQSCQAERHPGAKLERIGWKRKSSLALLRIEVVIIKVQKQAAPLVHFVDLYFIVPLLWICSKLIHFNLT
jgi:hypothetical protein